MAENNNAYFQIVIKADGTYLHLIPAVGNGTPLEPREVEDYLSLKRKSTLYLKQRFLNPRGLTDIEASVITP